MRQNYLLVFLIICSLTCFIGYCAALIDWVQDFNTGIYKRNHSEAFWETSGLVLYTLLAIRFINSKPSLLE